MQKDSRFVITGLDENMTLFHNEIAYADQAHFERAITTQGEAISLRNYHTKLKNQRGISLLFYIR